MPEIPIRAFLVSLFAIRRQGDDWQVLLLQRAETLVGAWCQIAGKLENGETAWAGAVRELAEETGLAPQNLYSADICEQFYEPDRDAITMAPVFVAIIDPSDEVSLNAEHTDFRWVSFDDACGLVEFGGQRRCLRWIEEEFVHRRPSAHLRIETG